MNLSIGYVTDIGNYRNKNQDRVMCKQIISHGHILAIGCVCDGIGSFTESEIASAMVVDGLNTWINGITRYYPDIMTKNSLLADLEFTIQELNELVYEYGDTHHIDIGCTMSLLIMLDHEYFVFHVGDSRIYCLRDKLYQLTQDEVILRQINGREKTMLVNYIGKNRILSMSKKRGFSESGDMYIIGSDGLYELMTYEDVHDMKRYITKDEDVEKVCKILTSLVLQRGEKDNVTCAIMQVM